jgi:hypothetical protein
MNIDNAGRYVMYESDCDCCRDGCLYRGEMYDVCRARLGMPKRCGLNIKMAALGAIIAAVSIFVISCCIGG